MVNEKRVPVQGDGAYWLRKDDPRRKGSHVPGTIAWSEHVEAWDEYARRGHGSQSAERVAARGGYAYLELVDLLGREPNTWEPR